MSLISFLKILTKLKKSRILSKYKSHEGLNNVVMSPFEVKMGFGLHVGWAIEGAIGSFYKIDASYLSPHVNLASRLEGATKSFGVPILLSGELYSYFSEEVRGMCRQVDRVIVKGRSDPLDLYTCDSDTSTLQLDPQMIKLTS
jgi:class 3 adenylate cyclase